MRITPVRTGRASDVSIFHFYFASDAYRRPRRASLPAEKFQAAGIIFNVAFGQYPVWRARIKGKKSSKKSPLVRFS